MKKCNNNLLGCHRNSKENSPSQKWQSWAYGNFNVLMFFILEKINE